MSKESEPTEPPAPPVRRKRGRPPALKPRELVSAQRKWLPTYATQATLREHLEAADHDGWILWDVKVDTLGINHRYLLLFWRYAE